MRRREFVAALGGAAAWPLAAGAQPMMPVVGFLRSTPAAPFAHIVEALRQGLKEEGFDEGRNVAIEQRWADNQPDRLPGLAADLVRRQVNAIVGNGPAINVARTATTIIPLVFVVGDDPVKSGLVENLNRPGGNLTGVTFFGGSLLNAKRIELLHELMPNAAVIAVLMDPNSAGFVRGLPDVEAAGRAIGRQIVVVNAASESEFETAFVRIAQTGARALLVSGGPFFTSRRRALVALVARQGIPAIYDVREFVEVGGLISYSASISGAYRQAGAYVAGFSKARSLPNCRSCNRQHSSWRSISKPPRRSGLPCRRRSRYAPTR